MISYLTIFERKVKENLLFTCAANFFYNFLMEFIQENGYNLPELFSKILDFLNNC